MFQNIRKVLSILKTDFFAIIYKKQREKKQRKLLKQMLIYAKGHCQFYNNIIPECINEENCIEVLKELPVVNKQVIRNMPEKFYSSEITKDWPHWLNTGGSTGEPFRFPYLVRSNLEGLCQRLLYRSMGSNGSLLDLIVSVDGTRIDEGMRANNIFWKKKSFSFPYGKYNLSTLYMDHNSLNYYVDFLNRIKPTIMRGYPSGFLEIANFVEKERLSLNFRLKGIYLTSESFSQIQEDIISRVFNCPVFGQYGHTEASIFAIKFPNSSDYYALPIYGYTEILGENNKQVSIGTSGRIVVTGFTHLGLPFIRYDTGDLGVFGGVKEDGTTVISHLMGRSVDYVINKQNKKIYLIGLVFGGHLKAFNYIEKWQIEQDKIGCISLRIVRGKGYNSTIENDIVMLFKNNNIDVRIIYVSSIEKTVRGKEKFIIQKILS